jgi:hypothetical protein
MPNIDPTLPLFADKEVIEDECKLIQRLDALKAIIRPGKPSVTINRRIASIIKRLRIEGYYNHQIASMLGCNQGRIAEINRGHTFSDVPPA